MFPPPVISRRFFLAGGVSLCAAATAPQSESVYEFAASGCEVRMTVAFYDRYSSSGLRFQELLAGSHFCLSASGYEDRDCAARFVGSLAVARYRFDAAHRVAALREHVDAIDRDARLVHRPAFDRTIELRQGIASDIQAFGYETDPPLSSPSAHQPEAGGPWVYFRQDLYFEGRDAPFLIVHWRHAFGGIRILDVIPGEGTRLTKGVR
jgi:hypothetical protein